MFKPGNLILGERHFQAPALSLASHPDPLIWFGLVTTTGYDPNQKFEDGRICLFGMPFLILLHNRNSPGLLDSPFFIQIDTFVK